VLSGAARTGWRRLAPLFAIGLVGRLALLWSLGRTFRDEVKSVLDLLNRYQLPLIVITLVVVVAVNVRNFRKGA
jgi:membrane protein DedA with SNARE-associated domain